MSDNRRRPRCEANHRPCARRRPARATDSCHAKNVLVPQTAKMIPSREIIPIHPSVPNAAQAVVHSDAGENHGARVERPSVKFTEVHRLESSRLSDFASGLGKFNDCSNRAGRRGLRQQTCISCRREPGRGAIPLRRVREHRGRPRFLPMRQEQRGTTAGVAGS